MANYQTVKLDKNMYHSSVSNFSGQLERLDPSCNYTTGALAGSDAFQRQLKRFDIKVSGPQCDLVEKFFATPDSAVLFPEYVSRAIAAGMQERNRLPNLVAAKTYLNARDYRSIDPDATDAGFAMTAVEQGAELPVTAIRLKADLVKLNKYGRQLQASYEAIRHQKIDLFTVALKNIGAYMADQYLDDAVDILINGDGASPDKPDNISTTAALTYTDLVNLMCAFRGFALDTLLVSPKNMATILSMEQMSSAVGGAVYRDGNIYTPFGAALIVCDTLDDNTIVGIDSRYALEMAIASDITVESDKLIHCQLERTAICATAGFARLFKDAVKTLTVTA